MESLMYMAKARRAYDNGDYKLCIVLMRRTPLRDPAEIQLFVNAVYFGWKYGKSNLSMSEIQEAYSGLFNSTEGSNIPPFEFVRLSHIYIKSGNLAGAMKTMQYAAWCGHLSSTIAVLQTWSILRKIDSKENPLKYMSHLCDMAPMETPEEDQTGVMLLRGTDIPLYMVYLHVAVHLNSQARAAHSRDMQKNLTIRAQAVIAEAYTFVYKHHPLSTEVSNAWYSDHVTWTAIAQFLEDSACILVAEESYFIAFTCAPLRDDLIDPCLRALDAHNRSNENFMFLEKAYRYNHWNMRCRQLLLEQETNGHYKQLFKMHHIKARRIQSAFRGFYTRCNWEEIYDKMKIIKGEYHKRIERAQKLRTAALQRHLRYRVRTWKDEAAYLKRLRFYSAQAIQMLFRCYWAKKRRRTIFHRRVAANKKYLMSCEIHHNMYLMQILNEWNRIYIETRNNNRADLIRIFLKTNMTQMKLKWAAKKLLALLNIRRKFNNSKNFKKWREAYLRKRVKHATFTIRFFIRDVLLRVKKCKAEMKLKRVKSSVAGGKPISMDKIVKNMKKIDLLKHWNLWKEVMHIRREHDARLLLARRLPAIHRHKKLRDTLNRERARREFVVGHTLKVHMTRMKTHYAKWKLLWAVLVGQRALRIFLARCRLQRRMYQLQRSDYMFDRSWKRIVYHRFNSWFWCVRKSRLMIRCTASLLVRWWRRKMLKGRLIRFCKRKYGIYKFVHLLHSKYLRKAFGQLNRMVFAEVKIKAVTRLVTTCESIVIRFAFSRLSRNCYEQEMLEKVMRVRLKKRLQRSIFSPVNTSGWVYSSVTGYADGNMSMMNWNTGKKTCISPFWPPLLNKTTNKMLLDTTRAKLLTAFQCWAMLFRLRSMNKINCAASAVPSVLSEIISNFREKTKCSLMVQNLFRKNKAKEIVRVKRLAQYVLQEQCETARGKSEHYFCKRAFNAGLEVIRIKQRARLSLQCWVRGIIAKRVAQRRAGFVANMNKWEQAAAKISQKRSLKVMMRMMEFGCALRACEVRQSSPREMHIQFGSKNSDIEAIFRKVDRMKKGSNKDFASEEYHSHIFRLRQSGVLIIDSSTTLLRHNELSFLIQSARTIFSQSSGEHTSVIRDVTRFFLGDKIIFCGGTISDNGARELFYMLSTREDPIALHLSEVKMPYKGISRLARAISLNFAKMREFSVDSASVGSLGLATLLVALKDNHTILSVAIKLNSEGVVLPCYSDCFKCILRNSFLKELRIFGSTLNADILQGILYAVKYGLSGLRSLEFDYITADKSIVNELIHLCGMREQKKTGSNVTVRATEFSPRDILEETIMRGKRGDV